MRFIYTIFLFLLTLNSVYSQSKPKKIILDYYSDIPFQYIDSNDEFTQTKIGLFVREISIDVLNKFLEDFLKNIQEQNGYLIVINITSSREIKIEIPFAINQNKLDSLRESNENFKKICNFILMDGYEWIIRYL